MEVAPLAPPGAPADAFPEPDRPVARIVTDTWSDERTRDNEGEAERVMDLLGVEPGMRVADIGAGSGYYTVRLARRVGPEGRVAVVDLNRPTPRHGTPPALLRCEFAAVGYRQVASHDLGPAGGYLAVFEPPAAGARRTAPDSVRACAA